VLQGNVKERGGVELKFHAFLISVLHGANFQI
jgi:hypothetical protein